VATPELDILFHAVKERLPVTREDENIIQVETIPSEMRLWKSHSSSLEGGQAVGEAKVHDQGLEKSPVGTESCLPPFMDADVVVASMHVQLCEILGAMETIDEVVDQWEGVTILSGDGIESPVILHEA
jgi:hypothetical protein